MKLLQLLSELFVESRVDFLKNQTVGKVLEPEQFDQIVDIDPTQKKLYTQWLINVYNKDFKQKGKSFDDFFEDKDNIVNKINFFEKNKSLFKDKDINKYSLPDLNQNIDQIEKDLNIGDQEDSTLTPVELDKLKKVGIQFLGDINGYQVIRIPKGNDGTQTFNTYRNIICQGKTHVCTSSNYSKFQYYLFNDDLFIILKNGDDESPYHFSYFTDQFSNKNDKKTENPQVLDIAKILAQKYKKKINENRGFNRRNMGCMV